MMRYFIIAILAISMVACDNTSQPEIESVEVLVVGGGASGVTAAIQAARLGTEVLLLEETQWVGGMLTSAGVSAVDGNYKLNSGLWHEFRLRLYDYYGGPDSVKTGWVSNVLFEPQVGQKILREMISAEKNIDLRLLSSVEKVLKSDNGWQVKFRNGEELTTVEAKIVIDATELGDIAKQVGASYEIGMDSRAETGEDIAPEKGNNVIQDLTFVAILKEFETGDTHLLEKPEGYDPSSFYCTCGTRCDQDSVEAKLWDCQSMMNYGKLPNGYYMINWPIYGNDYYINAIESTEEERQLQFDSAKWYTKCYVYYLQTELGFSNLGIANDVFPTQDGFPLIPYHRESRRVKGEVLFTLNHLAKPYSQENALYRTGIAVGDYPVDHHHRAYKNHKELPDLHFYPVPSYTIPLGALIPKGVDQFIVAEKSISVTNIVNGTTRLQPVCLLLGQAAGALAAVSIKQNSDVVDVSVREVQRALLDHSALIQPYIDVPVEDEAFISIQKIGSTGILKAEGKNIGWSNVTLFHPDSVVLSSELISGLNEFFPGLDLEDSTNIETIDPVFLTETLPSILANYYSRHSIQEWEMDTSNTKSLKEYLSKQPQLTRRNMAIILDIYFQLFDIPVSLEGRLIKQKG